MPRARVCVCLSARLFVFAQRGRPGGCVGVCVLARRGVENQEVERRDLPTLNTE